MNFLTAELQTAINHFISYIEMLAVTAKAAGPGESNLNVEVDVDIDNIRKYQLLTDIIVAIDHDDEGLLRSQLQMLDLTVLDPILGLQFLQALIERASQYKQKAIIKALIDHWAMTNPIEDRLPTVI